MEKEREKREKNREEDGKEMVGRFNSIPLPLFQRKHVARS